MFILHQALQVYLVILLSLLVATDGAHLDNTDQTLCKGYNYKLETHVKICPNKTDNHTECELKCGKGEVCISLFEHIKTGDTRLAMKDCWKNAVGPIVDPMMDFCNHREGKHCRKRKAKGVNYYICRCCGNLCNARNLNMTEIENLLYDDIYLTTPKQETVGQQGNNKEIVGILGVVGGFIFLLSSAIIIAMVLWRRTKRKILQGRNRTRALNNLGSTGSINHPFTECTSLSSLRL